MHLTTIFVDLLQGNIVSIQQQTCIYPQNNNVKIYSVNIQISLMYFQICRLTPVSNIKSNKENKEEEERRGGKKKT